MKRKNIFTAMSLLALALAFISCNKNQRIDLAKQNLVFSPEGGVEMISVSADCDWTIELEGEHDWYTLSQTSGTRDAILLVNAEKSKSFQDRHGKFTVVSADGKVKKTVLINQTRYEINDIVGKAWFLRFYERWNTDFYDEYIEDSYRQWTYYTNQEYVNWYLYFVNDSIGYQIRTKDGDTIYYPYEYIYYPDGDSLYINFETITDTVEDYHCNIYQLDDEMFVFSNEYRRHYFEKLYNYNVTATKACLNPNPDPKKVMAKPRGPMVQIEP